MCRGHLDTWVLQFNYLQIQTLLTLKFKRAVITPQMDYTAVRHPFDQRAHTVAHWCHAPLALQRDHLPWRAISAAISACHLVNSKPEAQHEIVHDMGFTGKTPNRLGCVLVL